VTADVSMDDAIELLRRRLSTGVTFRIDSSETAVGFGQDCCGPVQRTTRYTVFVSRGGTHFVQACDFRLTDAVLIAVSEFAAQAAAAAAAERAGGRRRRDGRRPRRRRSERRRWADGHQPPEGTAGRWARRLRREHLSGV
jgi:hypothetical protein